jgi:biotin carboxyl carrier protein
LLLIESMKLQTEIKAPIAGVVSKIGFEAGGSFDKGAVLADVSGPESEA